MQNSTFVTTTENKIQEKFWKKFKTYFMGE